MIKPAEATPKPKCPTCQKRLALTDFACRCGPRFCALHRVPDAHACKYDFRAEAQKLLTAQLARVVGEKLEKI
jgi:predicted nucleic acid binding AN1-type Zn finger protein